MPGPPDGAGEYPARRGRLIINRFGNTLSDLDRKLPHFKQSALMFAPVGQARGLLDDLLVASVIEHFLGEALPRSPEDFERIFQIHRGDFIPALERADQRLHQAMTGYQKVAGSSRARSVWPWPTAWRT